MSYSDKDILRRSAHDVHHNQIFSEGSANKFASFFEEKFTNGVKLIAVKEDKEKIASTTNYDYPTTDQGTKSNQQDLKNNLAMETVYSMNSLLYAGFGNYSLGKAFAIFDLLSIFDEAGISKEKQQDFKSQLQSYVELRKSLPDLTLLTTDKCFKEQDASSRLEPSYEKHLPTNIILWSNRHDYPDKAKLKAHEFLQMQYGKAIEAGMSRAEIRAMDERLVGAVEQTCKKAKLDDTLYLPPKAPRGRPKMQDKELLKGITKEQKAAVLREHNRETQQNYRQKKTLQPQTMDKRPEV